MLDSYSVIYRHVAATLPDSITARKVLLEALRNVLAKGPIRDTVDAQLAAITSVEQLQAEFKFRFEPKP
jgi:hypothetical protein